MKFVVKMVEMWLWVEMLNKSFEETVEIKKKKIKKKNQPLGFPVLQLEHLKFKYEMAKIKKKANQKLY